MASYIVFYNYLPLINYFIGLYMVSWKKSIWI
jgi:hypothetical protein